ncbi:MAG: NADH:flavin oxidoreductase [Anaerolineae bacterium]|jgi:2,4-dienoyl-CoA reductase-like NADH-dependent reductase (Old Yellow Enzyme family)
MARYRRVAALRSPATFRAYLHELGVVLPFDDVVETGPAAPLARPYRLRDGALIGNRFCIQPMEGWDGTLDGRPTDLVRRRWARFGQSGAKLIWGGEAVAVRYDGRANPRQLVIDDTTLSALADLRRALVAAHAARFGRSDDLLVGLQLTHSGRFARPEPDGQLAPRIAYHHPLLDARVGLSPDDPVLADAEIEEIVAAFVRAAALAHEAGFQFVDVKHCHGYLGHELLSAHTRPGPYGGSFENRTRFLRQVVAGIRRRTPGLRVGVRLSAFDFPPFHPGPDGVGVPDAFPRPYPFAFGVEPSAPLEIDLAEPKRFLALLLDLGIELVNLSAGNPYATPHVLRPALFPPSDGYGPPEDPLVGVSRQVAACAELKQAFPGLCIVGSAYSYLQEWLPHVAQHNIRTGRVDFAGLGRSTLAYPDLPADVLAGKPLDRRRLCRTFSDCTTAPRHGLVSGCYPFDPFYKARPEAARLAAVKAGQDGR